MVPRSLAPRTSAHTGMGVRRTPREPRLVCREKQVGFVGDVGRDGKVAVARLEVDRHDSRPFFGEATGCGRADPGGAAGNEAHAPCQAFD